MSRRGRKEIIGLNGIKKERGGEYVDIKGESNRGKKCSLNIQKLFFCVC